MKCGKLEECIIGKTKIKEIDFEEKLNVILTGVDKRKDEEEIKRKEEEEMNRKLKEMNNERKIDFFLNKNNEDGESGIDIDMGTECIMKSPPHFYYNKSEKNKTKQDILQVIANNNDNEMIKEEHSQSMNHYSIEEDEEDQIIQSPQPMELKDLIKGTKPTMKDIIPKQEEQSKDSTQNLKLPNQPIINPDEIIQMSFKQPKVFKTQIKVDNITQQILTTKQHQLNNTISSIHSTNPPSESKLLLEYKKEKQLNTQLNNILTNNISVLKNSHFTTINNASLIQTNQSKTKPMDKAKSFYQTTPTIDKLAQTRKLLEDKLTIRERESIFNANRELSSLKEEHKLLLEDRQEIESLLKLAKDDYMKFKANRDKEIDNTQRKNSTAIKSIVNKYKLDMYQNDLKPKTEKYIQKQMKGELEALKTEVENIKGLMKQGDEEHKAQVKKYQNDLEQLSDANALLMMKIKSYEEDRLWKEISTQKSLIDTVNQLTNVTQQKTINKAKGKKEVVVTDDDLFNGVKIKPVRALHDDNEPKKYDPYDHMEDFELVFDDKYHKTHEVVIKEEFQGNGIIVKEYSKGKRELLFPSGQRKEIFNDGYQVIYYKNGDIKQIFPNDNKQQKMTEGKELYYYSNQKTIQLKYADGRNYLKFPDGHIETINQ